MHRSPRPRCRGTNFFDSRHRKRKRFQRPWIKSAVATFPEDASSDTDVQTRDANNVGLAPGGAGATVILEVKGTGTFVENANISYQAGADLKNANLCGIQHELSYYEVSGERKEEVQSTPCSWGASWANFPVNREFKADSPMCARAIVSGQCSNYAWVTIKP